MDPTDPDRVQLAVQKLGTRIGQHEEMLQSLHQSLHGLSIQMSQLAEQLLPRPPPQQPGFPPSVSTVPSSPPPPPATLKEPYVPPPEPYAGEIGGCRGFLLRCALVFDQQPISYPSDRAKVAYTINLLRGRAAKWATAVWDRDSPLFTSYARFSQELRRIFDFPVEGPECTKRLFSLTQSSRSVAEYSIEFRTVAAESGWGDLELKGIFTRGLSEQLKDELATRDEPPSLEELIALAIRVDNRLRERRREKKNHSLVPRIDSPSSVAVSGSPLQPSVFPDPAPSAGEPMQIGHTKLHPDERRRRVEKRLCIYCGQAGHFLINCPNKLNGQAHQ